MKVLTQPKVLKGFRDYLPNEALVRNNLIRTIEKSFQSFGFSAIDTPALEYTETLMGAGSEETDKQLYRFKDNGKRDVALRFDLTIPLARYVCQHKNELNFPFKRYHIAPVWRAEKPQRGRFREFMQCDIDIIGAASLLSDAEILSCISLTLSKLNLKHQLKINSREISSAWFEHIGVNEQSAEILRALDKIDKIGKEKVEAELKEIVILSQESIDKIFRLINIKSNSNDQTLNALLELSSSCPKLKDATLKLQKTLKLLKDFGLDESNFIIDLSIARGLDYYTGIVFETELTNNKIGSVSSGGRYDNLTSRFQKAELNGVGASIGIDRIVAALLEKEDNFFKNHHLSLIAINMGDDSLDYTLKILSKFREHKVQSQVYLEPKKLAKQFKYADDKGINYALIAGKEEKNKGVFSIKNLATGEQNEFSCVSAALKHINNS